MNTRQTRARLARKIRAIEAAGYLPPWEMYVAIDAYDEEISRCEHWISINATGRRKRSAQSATGVARGGNLCPKN